MMAKEVLEEKLKSLKLFKSRTEHENEQLRLDLSNNMAHLEKVNLSIEDIENALKTLG